MQAVDFTGCRYLARHGSIFKDRCTDNIRNEMPPSALKIRVKLTSQVNKPGSIEPWSKDWLMIIDYLSDV